MTSAVTMRADTLPRSLNPLLHESLPGYLMRLSHRLDLTPACVAMVTGIAQTPQDMPIHRIAALTGEHARRFARAACLTIPQVNNMTLSGLHSHYRPLGPAGPSGDTNAVRRIAYDELWVFTAASRYCPECLAGNGSHIPNEHGGGWNKYWRLPPFFACTDHRRLLQLTCPVCGTHAQSRSPAYMVRLVPLTTQVLHPLQCRAYFHSTPCPGTFNLVLQPATPALEELDHLLALQDHFSSLLVSGDTAARSLGNVVNTADYFEDLRIVSMLLRATWGRVRLRTSHPALHSDLDLYFGHRDHRLDLDMERARLRHSEYSRFDTPPLDPAAGGSLLALAVEILEKPIEEAARVIHLMLALAPQTYPHVGRRGSRELARCITGRLVG